MAVSVGQQAPDVELPLAGSKEKFKLSDYAGKQPVVLLFFPLAWTSVCTAEMCGIRDTYQRYQDLGAKVVGISVDSPFALEKFKAEQNLPFDMASDFNKEAIDKYGAKYEDLLGFKGVAKRSAFVIDKNGKIAYAQVNDDAKQLPDFDKVQQAIRSAQ
jgi:glutaredoxin-dependent peroxiredoxin